MNRGGRFGYATHLALSGLLSLLAAGCHYQYVVDDAVLRQIADTPPEARVGWAVPARRPDGTFAFIRADSVELHGPLPSSTRPKRVTASRGNILTGMGVMLESVGAVMTLGGAAVARDDSSLDDQGFHAIVALPLLTFGVGHLVPGIVLNCVGAVQHPEDVEIEAAITSPAGPPPPR